MKGIRSQTAETERLRMHYLESGPPDGVPVVMVHVGCVTPPSSLARPRSTVLEPGQNQSPQTKQDFIDERDQVRNEKIHHKETARDQ